VANHPTVRSFRRFWLTAPGIPERRDCPSPPVPVEPRTERVRVFLTNLGFIVGLLFTTQNLGRKWHGSDGFIRMSLVDCLHTALWRHTIPAQHRSHRQAHEKVLVIKGFAQGADERGIFGTCIGVKWHFVLSSPTTDPAKKRRGANSSVRPEFPLRSLGVFSYLFFRLCLDLSGCRSPA